MDIAELADPTLFVVPASGPEAQEHISLSISRPINESVLEMVDASVLAGVNDSGVFAWAAAPGDRNTSTYGLMQIGDFVLFYQDRHYSYVCRVKAKLDDENVARAIWGEDSDGKVWSHIFFVSKPTRIDVPLERLSDYLQTTFYRGFMRLSAERAARIRSDFGSVETFVEEELLAVGDSPNGYLLLRSNDNSKWNDSRESYRFGRTVPNYKKLKVGTAIVVDSKRDDKIILRYMGRITDITDEGSGVWSAVLSGLKPLGDRQFTERELANLRSEPGYNVQHAIRPISASLFQELTGTAPISALPGTDPIDELKARLMISHDRAASLLELIARTRQIILSGPPGTGKTYFARELARVWVGDDSRWGIVQFHPSYAYEDFIEGIRPDLNAAGKLSYVRHHGALLRMVELAKQNPAARYVLVVDELNRANSARVFGELLYSLEYRGLENSIILSSGVDFYIPENLWLICTLNSADRSIATLDAAFRRRFKHISMGPDYEVLEEFLRQSFAPAETSAQIQKLRSLNTALQEHVGPDRLIGHTYLLHSKSDAISFQTIWDEEIEPVIADYLYKDPDEQERLREQFIS